MEQSLKQSLKQYFNECLATMPLCASYNNDSYKERVERDVITIALLKLSTERR